MERAEAGEGAEAEAEEEAGEEAGEKAGEEAEAEARQPAPPQCRSRPERLGRAAARRSEPTVAAPARPKRAG